MNTVVMVRDDKPNLETLINLTGKPIAITSSYFNMIVYIMLEHANLLTLSTENDKEHYEKMLRQYGYVILNDKTYYFEHVVNYNINDYPNIWKGSI